MHKFLCINMARDWFFVTQQFVFRLVDLLLFFQLLCSVALSLTAGLLQLAKWISLDVVIYTSFVALDISFSYFDFCLYFISSSTLSQFFLSHSKCQKDRTYINIKLVRHFLRVKCQLHSLSVCCMGDSSAATWHDIWNIQKTGVVAILFLNICSLQGT